MTEDHLEELLKDDGLISIHHKNIQVLVTDMYKVKNDFMPKIFSNLFSQTEISSISKDCIMGGKISHILVSRYLIFSHHQ